MIRAVSATERTSALPKRAVFLDKDGTLVQNVPYNIDLARVRLMPNAVAGLLALQDQGYELHVVTNQSGIARAYFSLQDWERMQAYLSELMASHGICIKGFYFCPHHPEGRVEHLAVDCTCRKPMPGMLMQAAREQGIALDHSWMIGDILHDVEAGARAGCRTILIDNGNETEWETGDYRKPDVIACDLLAAAQAIFMHDRNSLDACTSITGMNHPGLIS